MLHAFDSMIRRSDSKCAGRMLVAPTTYCLALIDQMMHGWHRPVSRGFDISVLEIFWPLCFGFAVFLVSVTGMLIVPLRCCCASFLDEDLSRFYPRQVQHAMERSFHAYFNMRPPSGSDHLASALVSCWLPPGQEADVLQGTPALWRSLVTAGWKGHEGPWSPI